MKGNVGGIIVIGIAAFLIVMGIRGSQHALFPQLFGAQATEGVAVGSQSELPQPITQKPDKNGHCPPGWILYNGTCKQFIGGSILGK